MTKTAHFCGNFPCFIAQMTPPFTCRIKGKAPDCCVNQLNNVLIVVYWANSLLAPLVMNYVPIHHIKALINHYKTFTHIT